MSSIFFIYFMKLQYMINSTHRVSRIHLDTFTFIHRPSMRQLPTEISKQKSKYFQHANLQNLLFETDHINCTFEITISFHYAKQNLHVIEEIS